MSGTRTNRAELGAQRGKGETRLPWLRTRRALFASLVAATTLVGALLMWRILDADGLGVLAAIILALFTLTFAWITAAFWSAAFGFVVTLSGRDPLTLARLPSRAHERALPIRQRTVLAMPIHNEPPDAVVANLEATANALIATGEAHHFEGFVLSDTTDTALAAREAAAIAALQRRLADRLVVHYRRRADNRGRKAGNLAEFCRRWGRRYDFMVVLDADSRMSGEALLDLVRALQARPEVGLIQSVPLPARQATLFGRLAQFAAALYAPMLAAGQSSWQGDAANYWGHNAILRLHAFMAHCGLPELRGRPPLGGEILSHDFVEAALLRRAGWEVQLDTRIAGSYEEMPGNLLDYARRDRRWTQGNLQHLRLLAAPGLQVMSRLHFVMGAMAFISSLLWLAVLLLGSLDAVLRAQRQVTYFPHPEQLFPLWPQARPELIAILFATTLGLLLLPKLMGLLLALVRRPEPFGGRLRLLASALLEALVAVLLAPVMMLFHSAFVLGVLTGARVEWGAQAREGRAVAWADALRHTAPAMLLGALWAGLVGWLAPALLWWLSPIWGGLLLAPLLARWSGERRPADGLARLGLLTLRPRAEDAALLAQDAVTSATPGDPPLPPPPERPGDMPLARLSRRSPHGAATPSPRP
ncbi:glucans biosynthesis glucosyltransferase MdoH [Halomonas campisalis]|uniref:Glucans biosynthesis glucosyltransferase H n=1 Tax=Billgrantia campisalis TaxID=74661 RepID=A0ABS9P7T2_9GAMM|nr:glucans biosynthesis glucosyltransferase MdoH [Halomonas campisalis]MCG6657524.1 glucans biosynthesis glucosyltransferase MdoH [Halomonas campisalis]MDR5863129.1 glucans biosynthesis glucosyltransferase MdoH [Halomonas campisalis]